MPERLALSPFWLAAWSLTAALAWLLPNHYLPWTAFHMDAWMAGSLAMLALAIRIRSSAEYPWRGIHLLVAVAMLVVALQWATGLIRFDGTAWMNGLYLLGLLLALLTGSRWQSMSPGQPARAVLLAAGIAAFVSVGFQLHQWLRLDLLEIWVMPDNYNRPFANMGHPNQLTTLFLWALIGLAWAQLHGAVRTSIAVAGAMFLLFGLALTASRTSWVGIGWILLAAWAWRRLWPSRAFPWVLTLLAVWFALNLVSVDTLREVLLGGRAADAQILARATVQGENRPAIWWMLLDAALRQPWTGYGWGQVQWANLAVAADHTPKFVFFAHAHNLVLDLVLWMGIPLGLAAVAGLGLWLWQRMREVIEPSRALIVMLLLVTINHALLELPLHYGYFLLPIGLLAGALDAQSARRPWISLPPWTFTLGWLVAVSLLVLTVRDYSQVEREYEKLRFEWARIKTDPAQPPDVILLDSFPAFVRAVRQEPWAGMPAVDLQALEVASRQFPSAPMLTKLARAQALNGQPEAAVATLTLLCKIVMPDVCDAVRDTWRADASAHPAIKAVPWPVD